MEGNIKCFSCSEMGHRADSCPNKNLPAKQAEPQRVQGAEAGEVLLVQRTWTQEPPVPHQGVESKAKGHC